MTWFVIGVAVMVVLAWVMVLPAWRLRGEPRPAAARGSALQILKDQLAAVEREHAGDPAQLEIARREIERRILDETQATEAPVRPATAGRTGLLIGLAVPLFAIGVYAAIGNPGGLAPPPAAQAHGPDVTAEAVEAMLVKLAQRLEKPSGDNASDLKGWTMLGRSYAALQRFADADKAYARALALSPDDAQLLADRADVLAMVRGQSLQGEPDQLIARALKADPNNLKALALAGASAFERKDFATARVQWQKARDLAPPGSEFANGLERSLGEVGGASPGALATAPAAGGETLAKGGEAANANGSPATPAAPPTTTTAAATSGAATAAPAAADGARITGRVTLSKELAARVQPGDTVFVFARAAEGPRMPLAIVRKTVADLPFAFTLDDSTAMSPAMKLSNFPKVVVGVRVSRSGNAIPQSGDLRAESAPMAPRANDLKLVIDGVQP